VTESTMVTGLVPTGETSGRSL